MAAHGYDVRLYTPEPASIDLFAAAIAATAFFVIFTLRWPMLRTLAVSAGTGALLYYLFIG